MIELKDIFFSKDVKEIGLCAEYVSARKAIHVGLYVTVPSDTFVIHFCRTNTVSIESVSLPKFEQYYFIELNDYTLIPELPSLLAISKTISLNTLDDLILDLDYVVYNNGKFNISVGNLIKTHETESIINCAVFIIALLNTFDYSLINWETWPIVSVPTAYLEGWLNHFSIPIADRSKYYNLNKEIKGRHVISAPLAANKPSAYIETEGISNTILAYMDAEYTKKQTPTIT